MLNISIVAEEYEVVGKLSSQLAEKGFNCAVASGKDSTPESISGLAPDLVLLAMNGSKDSLGARYLSLIAKQHRRPPTIALLDINTLDNLDSNLPIDDFVIKPWDASEVALRVKRTIRRTKGVSDSDGSDHFSPMGHPIRRIKLRDLGRTLRVSWPAVDAT